MVLRIITVLTLSTFLLVANPIFADSHITINEFVPHPSSPNKEWVEFYNPENIDVSGYYLDDDTDFSIDSGSSSKKSLSSLNKSNQIYPYLESDSFLNNSGDYVVLFTSDGSIVDQYQYTKDPGTDVSMGRSPDGVGNFVTLAQLSQGSVNGEAKSEPTAQPTPQPTTTVSKSTTTTISSTSTKAQSPTPGKLATKSPSPQVTLSKSSVDVLGQSTQSANQTTDATSPTPQPSPEKISIEQKSSNTKVAYYMAGIGTILIAVSIILFFLVQRKGKNNEEDSYDQ